MQTRKKFFASVAAYWDQWRMEGDADIERVVKESAVEHGQRILDVGTGTGVLLPLLARAVGSTGEVLAIDNVREMIDRVNQRHAFANVSAAVTDIQRTDLPSDHFDRVLANACYPHFEDKRAALLEIHRLLKPNGLFVLSHPIGRNAVNALHRHSAPAVANDALPAPKTLVAEVEAAGFSNLRIIDEPDFFLLSFGVSRRTR